MKRKKQISKNPTHYPQKVRKEFQMSPWVVGMIVFTLLMNTESKSIGLSDSIKTNNERAHDGMVQIVYEKEALSVSIQDADLMEVIEVISRKCPIQIHMFQHIHTKVNLEFEDLPLEEGLKRLFNNQNYSLYSVIGYPKPMGRPRRKGRIGCASRIH